jgi:hypothetical protein
MSHARGMRHDPERLVTRKVCLHTGKIKYASRDRARKAMRGLSATLRAYRCPSCSGWHLTKG